jgi:hypothetical protein
MFIWIKEYFMNKRREHITARQEKKEHKEVKKGMKMETIVSAKSPKALKVELVKKAKHHKKTSKRTSTGQEIEGSAPAHVHTENEHWARCVRSQSLLKASRLKKKLSKRPAGRGRIG